MALCSFTLVWLWTYLSFWLSILVLTSASSLLVHGSSSLLVHSSFSLLVHSYQLLIMQNRHRYDDPNQISLIAMLFCIWVCTKNRDTGGSIMIVHESNHINYKTLSLSCTYIKRSIENMERKYATSFFIILQFSDFYYIMFCCH